MWPTPQHSPGGFAAIVMFVVVNGLLAGKVIGLMGERTRRGIYLLRFLVCISIMIGNNAWHTICDLRLYSSKATYALACSSCFSYST
jgi:hypothetical protein